MRGEFRPSPKAGPGQQKGAAIVAAMLVMTLAALLVAGLIWRANVQIRRVEAQRLVDQAEWIERGAVDWSRVVLRSTGDAAPTVDYIGQVWSLPIAQTRLSDFLTQIGAARAQEGAATYLSGNVEDLESRFNLRNLVTSTVPGVTTINVNAVQAYARLLGFVGVNPALANVTAQRMQLTATTLNSSLAGLNVSGSPAAVAAAGVPMPSANTPLAINSLDQLLDVPGYNPAILAVLAPYVTILPVSTPVNANTTSAQVLAAVVPGLTLSAAQSAIASRGQAYFRSTGDVSNILRASGIQTADVSALDVKSHFFVVHAKVRHERAEIDRDTLLFRTGVVPNATSIVSTRDEL
ncbi:MAG: type II secretion system minor pseudopilin GspK [Burkholderiaceae bacterium]